jgi:hypothetical protein
LNKDSTKLDFVGVGAAKAGTSWLATCLGEHPAVCMSEPKELNYFCEKKIWPAFHAAHQLGPQWLAERFAHCEAGNRLGEFSPSYLSDARCPELIFQHNPNCRLIFSFRHPVEALFSFYHQIGKEAPVANTLAGFLRDQPNIYRIGLYHHHVQNFLRIFPREQCLFLLFDDIKRDPLAVLRQCFSFIEVNIDFVPPSLTKQINEPKVPRSKRLTSMMYWAKCRVEASGERMRRFVWKLQLYRLHHFIMQRSLKRFTPTPMDPKIRQQLLDLYRNDTRALAAFLRRDLSRWEA